MREVRPIIFAYYHQLNEKASETRDPIRIGVTRIGVTLYRLRPRDLETSPALPGRAEKKVSLIETKSYTYRVHQCG